MKKFLRSSLRKKSPSPDRKESTDNRSSGYDLKEKELPKLHKAAWNGDLSKVKQLAKKGDLNQLDKANRTPMHLACAHGQFDVVQFLILNKAKLNICDNEQHSPLMKAVQGDHVSCIKLLLEHSADANQVDINGMTALHLAAHTGSGDAVALLLDYGAMVNATNKDGCTPLHLATVVASDDVVELLLNKGADVNATDKDQRTPLMYACDADQIGIVKLLLESKADTEIKDTKGWTAADHAVMNAHHGCSHLINEHSAAHRARPASRQGGMFRAPGTPAAPGAETANVGYGLGNPAADYTDEVLSQEEESNQYSYSHSPPPGDSWADTSEADDTTFGAPNATKGAVGVNLAKFVPASDTESNKSAPVAGKSKIPRAVSKESLNNVEKKQPSPIDAGDSKIPRLQKNPGGNSPATTPRNENAAMTHSDAAQTPRSTADTEADSNFDFSDDDDVLADLSAHSDSPVQSSVQKDNVEASPKNVHSKAPANTNAPLNMEDEKKSKKSAMAEELGLDDLEFDDEEEESQFDEVHMLGDTDNKVNILNPVGVEPSVDKKKPTEKDEADVSEIDWDSDEDLLPSQSSNKKGDSAANTPRVNTVDRLSPRALPFSNLTPQNQSTHPDRSKSPGGLISSLESDDHTEESESDWERERKAEKERKKLEEQMKADVKKEEDRMLQWEKEEQERKEREEREAKEAVEREKREAEEREHRRLEEEKQKRQEDDRKRKEEERKKEMERNREEEKRRQEDERRRAEERRREDERRRAEQQRMDEERRRRDDEDRKRRAEEDRQNAERKRKMEEEKREADKRRQEEQKKMEEQRREAQRKLEDERRKLEEDLKEQERRREIEKKKLDEEYKKNYEDKIAFNDRVSDFDDSESDWSNHQSPSPIRASTGLGRADSFERNRSSVSPRQPYTPGSANPSWKQIVAEEVDGLSFSDTDTEGDGMHSFVSSTPLPSPLLTSSQLPQVTDPAAMIQIQENIRDHKRLIDKERTARITMETKVKKLEMERNDLQRKIERLSQSKTSLEQEKMELDAKVRNLNYKLTEETEKANSAEALLEKAKEQLERKEQQYMQELEARQKVELSSRTLQMELRNALNSIKQLEEDKDEIRKELVQTRSAKDIQEQFNHDHIQVHEALQQEVEQFEAEKAEIFSRLETADENRKYAFDQNDRLKAELYGLKMELERVRSRYKDDQGMLAVENEELNNRIEELKGEIRLNEEALAHATMTYNAHLGAAKTENSLLVSNLDKEKSSREKLQTEVQSLSNRLTTTTHELEKSQQARSDLERTSQRERDDLKRTVERLEQELSYTRDGVQSKAQNLGAAESRLKSVEHELHISNLQLTERNGQLASLQRELDQRKSMLDSSEKELIKEKETRIKLEAKFEAASDRLSSTQNEMSQIKYESTDVQGKLDSLLSSLKSDHDKSEAMLIEKNKSLAEMVERLNSDLSKAEEKHGKQEQHIGQLQQELADVIKKLSGAEARLESAEKECTQLYKDKEAHANLHEKLFGSEKDRMTLEHKISLLMDKLEQTEKALQDAHQQLSNAQEQLEQGKEVEERYHQLDIEKAKLESAVESENKKVGRLEKELDDSQKVRSSLEALVANLKSANIHLEDRLSEETAARSLYAREADDHKSLWDSEVKSRSKLGLRIAQLERSKGEVSEQVNEEKKKTRKMAELKRQAETKLEAEALRNQQLQKEIGMMKSALKSAKRKLKELENPDLTIRSLQSNYDQERRTLGDTISGVRRQNEDLARQLQVENDMRASLEASNRQLQQELAALQNVKKDKEKLEKGYRKLQDQLGKIKANLGTGFIEKSEMDRFKQDCESQARQEINQKLEEVNAYLEEQAQARERLDDIRSNNEVQMKQDYERQINDMRAEVARMKAGHQESLVQKETAEAEAERYKDLYEKELKMRDKLREELEKATDKLSDAKAHLSLEKQRNRHMRENGLDLSNGFSAPHTNSVDPMTQKVRNELDKSIARHLGSMDVSPSIDTRENIPSNWGTPNGVNNSPLDKANSQYMSVLKKNYFV